MTVGRTTRSLALDALQTTGVLSTMEERQRRSVTSPSPLTERGTEGVRSI